MVGAGDYEVDWGTGWEECVESELGATCGSTVLDDYPGPIVGVCFGLVWLCVSVGGMSIGRTRGFMMV